MVKVDITKSKRADKRFVVVFSSDDGTKIKSTHSGLKNPKNGTFIDHQNNKLKENYLKRHKKNENWKDPMSAGALSRWVLWNKSSLNSSIEDYKSKFKLK